MNYKPNTFPNYGMQREFKSREKSSGAHWAVFEISAFWLLAGPSRSVNFSGPGRTDLGRKFLRAEQTWTENSFGPGRFPKN